MTDAKECFLNAWARLPERHPRYTSLMRQVEGYLGYTQPQHFEMLEGQRLVMTWSYDHAEIGGVRDDGWRIVFSRERLEQKWFWAPIAPALIVGLYSSTLAPGGLDAAGAVLRHGARQVRLECIDDKWAIEGRGELTEATFYEALMGLLRLTPV